MFARATIVSGFSNHSLRVFDEIMPNIGTTVASSDIGRMLQLIKASGWKNNNK